METQEESGLQAEVDELRRHLKMSSLGGSFASSVCMSSERGLSSIKQAIVKQGTLRKKSKYFGQVTGEVNHVGRGWQFHVEVSLGTAAAVIGTL